MTEITMTYGKRLLPSPGVVIALALVLIALAAGVKSVQASTPRQATTGDAVYFASSSRGTSDIWFVIPGQRPQRAAFSSRGSDDKDPAVSSDGRFLAFSSKRGGDFEIYVVDLRAGSRAKPRRVTTNTSADTNPAWSPNGRTIAYVTNRFNVQEIMTIPVAGCKRRQRNCDSRLTKNRYQDLEPAWSPDGRTIVFTAKRRGDRGFQIYTMGTTGRSTRRLTNVAANSTSPSWSPDGRSIAFVSMRRSSRDRTTAIYTMASSGRGQRKITSGTSNEKSPVWAPDGRSLTFVSVGRRSSSVSSVPSNGGRITRVMVSRTQLGSVAWGDPVTAAVVARPTSTPRPRPTATSVPPTQTRVPPTATSVPPTSTPVPTATSIPAPTATAVPAVTPTSGGGTSGGGGGVASSDPFGSQPEIFALSTLIGASINSSDGTYLGMVSRSSVSPDSICNTNGPYGSQYSPTSVRSLGSPYGARFGDRSAYDAGALDPPQIFIDGSPVTRLSNSLVLSHTTDPTALLRYLGCS